MAFRSKGFGDTTDYVMLGGVVVATILMAIFAGAPSWWLALAVGAAIEILIICYRRKPRRSYMSSKNREHHPL